VNEEALTHWGAVEPIKKQTKQYLIIKYQYITV
jgi:hypothetical protein